MAAVHFVKATGFLGVPTSLVIDVYDDADPGVLIGTIPNSDISEIGSTGSFVVDLRNVTPDLALPEDGSTVVKSLTLIWRDDGGVSVTASATVSGVDQRLAIDRLYRQEEPVYPTATVPVRGITAGVIAAGNPSYMIVKLAGDKDFATPVETHYEIFEYNENGRVSKRYPSNSPPSP